MESIISKIDTKTVYFRVQVSNGGICKWFYSADNNKFLPIAEPFTALPGKWVGAKVGLYAVRNTQINDSGYADVDWFHVEPIK